MAENNKMRDQDQSQKTPGQEVNRDLNNDKSREADRNIGTGGDRASTDRSSSSDRT